MYNLISVTLAKEKYIPRSISFAEKCQRNPNKQFRFFLEHRHVKHRMNTPDMEITSYEGRLTVLESSH